jgi:hypothetical protein
MNNNAITQSSANLYVAHSVKQKDVKNQPPKEEKTTPVPVPKTNTNQIINRSYYYDSMGGGYQGL